MTPGRMRAHGFRIKSSRFTRREERSMSSKPKEHRETQPDPSSVKQAGSAQTSMSDSARHKEIRIRAYEIYIERERDGQPGDELSDWLQAERERSANGRDVSAQSTPRDTAK